MIIHSSSVTKRTANYGGKANNLLELQGIGIQVPEFMVIPWETLSSFLPGHIQHHEVEDFIDRFEWTQEFQAALDKALPKHIEYFAVRSSGMAEDGNEQSFAGQFDTELFVKRNMLPQAIKKVWKSAYNERIEVYMGQYGLSKNPAMNIIVQVMIDADVSGVAFTVKPMTGEEEIVINSVFGLGEGLVSGELDADLFVVSSGNIQPQIATKNRALYFDNNIGYGSAYKYLEPQKSTAPSLSELEINELIKVLEKIQSHYAKPQDVEFCWKDRQLFILQTRPITTISDEPITIWDNSNIVESYPGLTAPLTFSFILKMYEAVYRQLSLVMGIRQSKIDENADVYRNMLGLLWGRVYYNLNNWHNALALLPGYELNADFMDKMMGVKEKFPTKMAKSSSKFRQIADVVRAVISILKTHRTMERERVKFLKHFHSVMERYESFDFEKMSKHELMERYLEFESTLSNNWRAPVVNDFFCMLYFGVLQKICVMYFGAENGDIHNNLLIGAKDIISTEPIHWTEDIVRKILNNEAAKALFSENDETDIWKHLSQPEFTEIKSKIERYLKKWGARCVGELKLETVTYDQVPENFIAILKSYVQNGHLQSNGNHVKHFKLRDDAEDFVKNKLRRKPFKRLIFKFVLNKTRYLVSNRENLRFERTIGFGMVRKMMMALGAQLKKSGVLVHERDVFYLTQQEIFDYILGTAVISDFKQLVDLRKKTYADYESIELPERIKSRGSVYENKAFHAMSTLLEEKDVLQGIPCCAGVVEGIVSVLHAPHEIDKINGNILVTTSTDPGWVVLFPKATAIVVERGSLLSHSAIVSREMGIPCIVGVKGLLSQVKSGDRIRMNGATGTIEILKRHE